METKEWMLISHVVPMDDLIEHDINIEGECICGPTIEENDVDGDPIVMHASLDGREMFE